MDNQCKEENPESASTGVFELPGEPAVVINGVPPLSPSDEALVDRETFKDSESHSTTGFGEWLIGREVRKLFGGQFYNGSVTEFDEETGWYRVVYEDGDFEDLEWHELENVLLPLDITVPLKTLASKVIKKRQKSIQNSRKSVSRSRKPRTNQVVPKEKAMEVLVESLRDEGQPVIKTKLQPFYSKFSEVLTVSYGVPTPPLTPQCRNNNQFMEKHVREDVERRRRRRRDGNEEGEDKQHESFGMLGGDHLSTGRLGKKDQQYVTARRTNGRASLGMEYVEGRMVT
ncbi:hypothetical protein RJ639_008993 [Escallonia herrerae]|uniref:PTM/DIR17-like Tudor domain-containing protein n=1 Tax=Escallonia herrerae TaxID=1293975 RepID=A0AA88VPL1_9ASTE|nr:hypothetical protein RJ639_008993 [Escallonia herrerae]